MDDGTEYLRHLDVIARVLDNREKLRVASDELAKAARAALVSSQTLMDDVPFWDEGERLERALAGYEAAKMQGEIVLKEEDDQAPAAD